MEFPSNLMFKLIYDFMSTINTSRSMSITITSRVKSVVVNPMQSLQNTLSLVMGVTTLQSLSIEGMHDQTLE
jgi:hypothetical protein